MRHHSRLEHGQRHHHSVDELHPHGQLKGGAQVPEQQVEEAHDDAGACNARIDVQVRLLEARVLDHLADRTAEQAVVEQHAQRRVEPRRRDEQRIGEMYVDRIRVGIYV